LSGVAASKWGEEDEAFLDIAQNLRSIIDTIEFTKAEKKSVRSMSHDATANGDRTLTWQRFPSGKSHNRQPGRSPDD
jgi:hypothetical protein